MTSRVDLVDRASLKRTAAAKYGDPPLGWSPAMFAEFGYHTPDDIYETLVDRLIAPGCKWLDVGCGRDMFPDNQALARALATRCGLLVGLDPAATIHENRFVHVRVQASLEEFQTADVFDVVTARMVVEHVQRPRAFVEQLRRLCAPNGRVVIYTVNKWAPVSIMAWIIPFAFHHRIKAWLWETSAKDTFPVHYLMNTRRTIASLMQQGGFREQHFEYLDDLRTLARFRWTSRAELLVWKALKTLGLRYPETCLLTVYQRADG
jgi:2-polyprenyl-3-methyl-5-hydroxy-6-metoxy-1,4-benzoquinol methylase